MELELWVNFGDGRQAVTLLLTAWPQAGFLIGTDSPRDAYLEVRRKRCVVELFELLVALVPSFVKHWTCP